MKRLCIAAALVAFWAPLTGAAEKRISAAWTYDTATSTAEGIVGFRLKDAQNRILLDNIPVTARTATVVVEGGWDACQSFYLTAFTAEIETPPSNIMTWCPPRKPLTGVATFTVELSDQ